MRIIVVVLKINNKMENQIKSKIITEGRYENVQFDELFKAIIDSPKIEYTEAITKIGPDNMPSMYDVASIKRYFHKRDKLDVFNNFGRFNRYMWTNEYLGIAPNGHPAEGELIMAKVEGINMKKQTKNLSLRASLGMEKKQLDGRIIVSDDRYVLIKDTNLKFNKDSLYRTILWCGEIQGFEEINGFMVPITKGGCRDTDCDCYNNNGENRGFGDLTFDGKNGRDEETGESPIALRPSSWSSLGFNRNNSINNEYTVLTKENLEKLL